MRLKKNHPTLDSTSAPSSASSATVPLPPNTLRKPKPLPADTLPPKEDPSASSPRQPSTLKKASPPARAMVGPSSMRSSSSSSSSSSTTTTTEAEVVSLNDDPDLKPEAPPSSSPTKLSQFTFRGWPVSRKPPSTCPPPPSRDERSSSAHGNYWSSVAPTNPQSQGLTPSSSAASAISSDTSTSPSLPWSSADMYRASSSASTSSSVYSVKVTAPTAPAIHHPFIPKRPYSAPVTSPPIPLSDSLPNSPVLIGEHPRRRLTANGRILYQTIPEGSPATQEASAATRPPEISVTPHGISSPAPSSPSTSRTSPSSDQGYAADNDGDSVGSDRSVIQAVTVVNELDKYSLHIKLPGFNPNNMCIASRRDRSLLITADRFEDEVPRCPSTADRSSNAIGREPSSSTHPPSTMPEGDEEERPNTPPERRSGHFERCVQFGPDAEPSRASARFDGETLVINVPKKKTWADVDVIHRTREEGAATPVLPEEKSPRSIALALAASPTASTGSRSERHLQLEEGGSGSGSGGSGSSAAVSPGAESTAESTTSTTPEGEMTSGSSCTDTSSVPSPMSEDGGSPLDEVSRRLDDMHLDLHDGSDEEEEGESRRGSHERFSSYHHQYGTEPPTPTSFLPRHPTPYMQSYPLSPNKQNSSEPSPIASWLSTTSATLPRSRSHSPPQPYEHGKSSSGSDSDSSEGRAAARRHFGIEDDLVTPTPQRVQKRRGPGGGEQTTAASTANHHAMSPKKDYFGFPLAPVLATTSATPDSEKTTPKSASPSASGSNINHPMLKQRSPTREAGPSGASLSPSRMPLSLRRGSVTSVDEDVVEHMRISLPPSPAASANPAPSYAGRTREQGMGRGAFFWKRWAPGQGS